MNMFIAKIFGAILAFCHILVVSILGYVLYLALKGENLDVVAEFGITPDNSIAILFGVFILYVIFSGFLSTVVSMHDQLVSIRKEIKGLQ